jgi:hypothetical protein
MAPVHLLLTLSELTPLVALVASPEVSTAVHYVGRERMLVKFPNGKLIIPRKRYKRIDNVIY